MMNKVIIRSCVGDEEIRYSLLLKKEFYDEYLKIKTDNPEMDDIEVLKQANKLQDKDDMENLSNNSQQQSANPLLSSENPQEPNSNLSFSERLQRARVNRVKDKLKQLQQKDKR